VHDGGMRMLRKALRLGRRLASTARFYAMWAMPHREDVRRLASGRPIVILLYGWGGTRHTMAAIEERLLLDGFAPYVFPMGGLFGRFNTDGIDDVSARLKSFLESLEMSLGTGRIAIVGHSMGGIVGRHLVSAGGGEALVHTLVTLGSPHRGSPVAASAARALPRRMSRALAQMAPGSDLMRRLAEIPLPASVYCVAIYSRQDAYCPPPSAELEAPPGASHIANADAGWLSHVELALDERAYEIVREALREGLARYASAAPRR